MRRAIVHIGNPRAASTTIQHVLARLRPQLADAGILYPDLTPRAMAHEPHISHQHLGETLDGRRPKAEAAELLDSLSAALERTQADVVLLSYEDFIQEKAADRIARRLDAVFRRHGFAMEMLLVVKPQAEHLNSVYSHRMQLMREKRVFAAFFDAFETSRQLCYAQLAEPWTAVCEGRARAVPLRDLRAPGPIVNRFFAELGLLPRVEALLQGEAARVENRSPGPVAVEIARRLRRMRAPSRLDVRPRDMMRSVEAAVFRRGLDATPFKGLDPARRARVAARHAAANERLAQAMWGQPWSRVVGPETELPPNELAGRPIEPPIEAAIREIIALACAEFSITLEPLWRDAPAELASDAADLARRWFNLSGWRVR